ncbi:PAS domain S-box protein [Alsobacter sp. SYSU M60028]|uniref:histidine kinase n=1 Tax=Alsobacter ponti TaxID=2962936 RepID=A0ABT1LDW9_9HYPH|nr:PAS domain-containing sensor histidine kinase [Alsobacter ponti]MCP8939298.1 PAS domain S-box protein [Alsobacter ponti]
MAGRLRMSGAEDRFRSLVEAVTDYAIYMLDPDGVVSTWNAGARRFKGYDDAEIIGRHFSTFYTPEDRADGLPERALRTAATEGRFEHEGWRVRKDGTRLWAHVIIDPIFGPDGQLEGFAKITRDVTEQRRAREELRRSEERFRLLVQGVTDYALYMLDPDGRVSNWNTGAERLKGYTEAEIVGQHFSRFYTDEDRAEGRPARALAAAVAEGRFVTEGWRVRKDGTRFWADVVVDAIRDAAGDLVGFAKITRDVTERRDTQKALEEANAKFVQAQKMEVTGQIAGGIAHDFNNLLAVILGNLELARKRLPDEPRLRTLLDNSIEAARRGASLTQRMLAFARRQDLAPEIVDPNRLVRGMSDLLQHSVGPGIPISMRLPARIASVLVDPNQLELALLNLVLNARDAMPRGGRIAIALREERLGEDNSEKLRPGVYLCIAVADTGEGMDEATLARAVEPFFTTKGVGKGTGLGLSMIDGFAGQSGGRLVLRSRVGEGTVAELWLPAVETVSAATSPSSAAKPGPARASGRALRVLVVDDDHLVLMNAVAMLEELGHEALEAGSGEEALELLRHEKGIDLVVTDQLMPGMKGDQLIHAARREHPNLPFVLATGYVGPEGRFDEADASLPKPYTLADLAETIASVVR